MSNEFYIKQNDTKPTLKVTLLDGDDSPADLTDVVSLTFLMRDSGSTTPKVSAAASIIDATSNEVHYSWSVGDTDTVGTYQAEWEATYSDGGIQTFPSDSYNEIYVVDDIG